MQHWDCVSGGLHQIALKLRPSSVDSFDCKRGERKSTDARPDVPPSFFSPHCVALPEYPFIYLPICVCLYISLPVCHRLSLSLFLSSFFTWFCPPSSTHLILLYTFASFSRVSLRPSSLSVWWRIANGLHWGVNCVGACAHTHTHTHMSIYTQRCTEEGESGERGKREWCGLFKSFKMKWQQTTLKVCHGSSLCSCPQ